MKYLVFLSLMFIVGCATQPNGFILSINDEDLAYASIAKGSVQASAAKTLESQSACFDITLVAKAARLETILPSNWTAAWVDAKSKYHLLNMNQRTPASVPKHRGGEWTSHFKACLPEAKAEQVKKLVLVPKDLPYDTDEWLELSWE